MSDLALLSTQGIQDPNVRNFLDRFLQVWQTKTSGGGDSLVSRDEVAGIAADAMSQALSDGVIGGASSGAPSVTSLIDNLTNSIRNAILVQVLQETITPVQLDEVRARIDQVLQSSQSSATSLASRVDQVQQDTQATIDTLDNKVDVLDTRVTGDIADLNTGITSEATTRASADSTLTTNLNAAVSRLGDAEAAITTEQSTRASADSALSTSLDAQIARIDDAEAAIVTEQTTRADADSALSSSLSTLTTRVDGNEADIATEQTVRSSADSSLSAQISLLTAGVAGSFDYGVVWYFDTTTEGWSAVGATIADNLGWVDIDSTGTDPNFISPTGLAINGAQYPVVKARIKRLAGSTWDGTCFYSVSGAHGFSTSYMKQIPEPATFGIGDVAVIEFDMSALDAGGSDWLSNTIDQIRMDFGAAADDTISVDWVAVGRNAPSASMAALLTEQQARITADAAEASARTTLTARVTTAEAGIVTEQTARANGDTALSNSISALTTTVNGNTAAITSEQTARINGDNTLASSISSLSTTVDANTAAINSEATARADADSSLSTTITSVSAVANAKNKIYRQAAAPTGTLVTGDLWFDSDDSNKAYRYDGSGWVATDDTRIAANAAAITSESTARANGDAALTTSINAQSARVDNVESAATTETNTRSTKDTALASAINRIWGFIGGTTAVIEDGSLASATPTSAVATKWNQVVASVTDPNTGAVASASILQETRTYANSANSTFNAIYSLKAAVSAGGQTVVGGFGLAATGGAGSAQGPTIAMGVLANQFYIAAPASGYNPAAEYGANLAFPFIVVTTPTTINGVTYQPGVYMKRAAIGQASIGTAEIQNAAITNAKIGDASITNAKIAGALYSDNWNGGQGWYIGRDGQAYFNRIAIYGVIFGSVFVPNNTIVSVFHGANRYIAVSLWSGSGNVAMTNLDGSSFSVRLDNSGGGVVYYAYV